MDKYGLVVRDLGDILTTLFKCLAALENFVAQNRVSGPAREAQSIIDGKTAFFLTL